MPDTSIKRTKKFSEVLPYTYTITRKSDGLQYHGVRYGNVRLGLSALEDFGYRYFSSGIFKLAYKKNPLAFDVKLRWTFSDHENAVLWESKVNGRILHRKSWANAAIGKGCVDIDKIKLHREMSFVEKYGVNHNFKIKSVVEKRDATIMNLYGVKNVGSSPEIRNKVENTNLKKFGVKCSLQSNIAKEKSKKSLIERYGVDNPRKSREINEKMRNNSIEKYGCEHTFQREDVKEKISSRRTDMYIRLAKMTESEFEKYLKTISDNICVQNQKIAQRKKGLVIMEENKNG